MKKFAAILLTLAMALSLAACGTGDQPNSSKAPENSSAPASSDAGAAGSEAPAVEWPGTDNDVTIYTRNGAGGAPFLGQQYFLDIVFSDTPNATFLLTDDATSGGAVCVEKTYAAGGDGYTFYCAGSEMVIGDVLGTFDYSLKDDFIPLGAIPSNDAPNYLCVSTTTLPDVKTFEDLVEYCKAHPGEVRLGYGPNAVGEVICKRIMEHYGLDVKWIISEGNDPTTNIMGGIIDVYLFNQTKTISLKDEYITPVLAASTLEVRKEELQGVPNYTDLGVEELMVESGMYLIAKNDMDPAMAEAINAKLRAAAEKVNANDPDEKVQILANHMATQEQAVQPLTIDECWAKINNQYKSIEEAYGGD